MATALPTPDPGEVIFHARCEPALQAGDYTLHVDHVLLKGGAPLDTGSRPLPPEREMPFTVDAPRFTLDPSQIHAVFPPTNGVGSYTSRLPMVVLRRRTLPWERRLAPGTETPWMALLLLEEGEGLTLSPCTVGDVLEGATGNGSPRLALPDVPQAARAQPCMGLELPLELFHDIAPMVTEVPLLTHVRQVDTADKELLGQDEDGWFAVVVGNRLPEPGKKYQACLVSLEGTQAFLPTEAMCQPLTATDLQSTVFDHHLVQVEAWLDRMVVDDPSTPREEIRSVVLDQVRESGSAYAWINGGQATKVPAAVDGRLRAAAQAGPAPLAQASVAHQQAKVSSANGLRQSAKTASWTQVQLKSESGISAPSLNKDAIVKLFMPKVRLFLLAQWSFECREGGDFEAIMQALPSNGGVAMLGMPPALAQAPEGTGAAVWKAALDTGHVPLPHLTREGEQTIAWFRGPLTPVGLARESVGPYHHADQARRVDPATGLENLGYAAAFEIGRLLALGDPHFALELMKWRRRSRFELDSALLARIFRDRFPGAVGLRLPELLDPRASLLLPRVLSALGTRQLDTLMGAGRLGTLRDPTGLLAVRDRLPGLDVARVSAAKGFDVGIARALLGPMAMDSSAVGGGGGGVIVGLDGGNPMNGSLVDGLGLEQLDEMELDLDRLALDPSAHFAPQVEQFQLNLQRFGKMP